MEQGDNLKTTFCPLPFFNLNLDVSQLLYIRLTYFPTLIEYYLFTV